MSSYIMQQDLLQPWLTVQEAMEFVVDLKLGKISNKAKSIAVSILNVLNGYSWEKKRYIFFVKCVHAWKISGEISLVKNTFVVRNLKLCSWNTYSHCMAHHFLYSRRVHNNINLRRETQAILYGVTSFSEIRWNLYMTDILIHWYSLQNIYVISDKRNSKYFAIVSRERYNYQIFVGWRKKKSFDRFGTRK